MVLFLMSEVPLYLEDENVQVREVALTFDGSATNTTLETTKGQTDGLFSQIPFKCFLPEVEASVGD